MNDRFKFRAKRIDNNKFIEGYLCLIYIDNPNKSKIYCPDDCCNYDVYTVTIGQCTGLKDRNGKLIYEGDILGGIYHGCIEYCNECKCFQLKVKDYGCLACEGDLHWYELVEAEEQNELEIIGNIYENPELLEN